jgi:alkanesulfonate monooxygenase SsuD/methylene tetrahydromethanopterin reductase-like flavin-dependent oxidoreductase (luciferase family)
MARAHFGVMVPQIKRTWEESKAAATEFESLGYDSLWVNDHLYGPQSPAIPMLEAWTLLGALAATTERVELGTLVTPAGMRNVAHLGKTIATVDHIAGGRVIPGLGAGWMAREFTDFDMPFLSPAQRVGQLREAVELLKRMWSEDEEEVTYEGKYVRAERVVTQPKPARRVPLMIGGGGEQVTLKIAAREADIWNNPAAGQGSLERKIDVLRGHCETVGRDPSDIRISQQCLVTIAADESTLEPMVGTAKRIFGGHMGDPTGPLALTGTPDRVTEQIEKHLELGCTMFMIEFFGRDTRGPARLFAESVLPRFK